MNPCSQGIDYRMLAIGVHSAKKYINVLITKGNVVRNVKREKLSCYTNI